jgi:hypothetical protein
MPRNWIIVRIISGMYVTCVVEAAAAVQTDLKLRWLFTCLCRIRHRAAWCVVFCCEHCPDRAQGLSDWDGFGSWRATELSCLGAAGASMRDAVGKTSSLYCRSSHGQPTRGGGLGVELTSPRRNFLWNVTKVLAHGGVGVDWIYLAQDRDHWRALVNTVMNIRIPQHVGKFLNSRATGGFSRRTQLTGVHWLGRGYHRLHVALELRSLASIFRVEE